MHYRHHRKLGTVKKAKFAEQRLENKQRRGAKRAGELYEKRVNNYLDNRYREIGGSLGGMWIAYNEENGTHTRYCQPDILLFDPWKGFIYLVECKLTHNTEAYYQMSNKYVPLLEWMFPGWQIAAIEVYKNMSGFKWPRLEGCISRLEDIKESGYYMWGLDV